MIKGAISDMKPFIGTIPKIQFFPVTKGLPLDFNLVLQDNFQTDISVDVAKDDQTYINEIPIDALPLIGGLRYSFGKLKLYI